VISDAVLSVMRWFSVRRSLRVLERVSTHVLIIAPSTRGALAFAQALCAVRTCHVTRGPVTSNGDFHLEHSLRTPAEISKAFAGQADLTRTVLSFPDQHICTGPSCVLIPFLQTRYAFSTLEALLVMRHRPRVFALHHAGAPWGFGLVELDYEDAFDAEGRLLSLASLMGRLFIRLADDLARPPGDWLARDYFALNSEHCLWHRAREELKELECLLRMHLQSRFCDPLRTTTALTAVAARLKFMNGTALP